MPFGLFEKGAEITLTIDRPQGPYYPGEVIHATLGLQVDKAVKVREVRVVLLLQSKYKTLVQQEEEDPTTHAKTTKTVEQQNSDEKEIDKQTPLHEGTINAGQTLTIDLHIPPDAVPVYLSPNIETHWVVKATVDRSMASDSNAEIQLPLIVPPPGTYNNQGEFGTSTNLDVAAMRISLPRLEYAAGETLNGELILEPAQDFEGREVRIELLQRERVTGGSQPNEAETSDQKMQLAGTTKYQRGNAVRYNFSLAVAPKGRPTFSSPTATAQWILKATVDRPWASDAESTQEIYVYSAARAT